MPRARVRTGAAGKKTYYVQIWLPIGSDGRRRQRNVSAASERELERKIAAVKAEAARGELARGTQTVGEYLAEWLRGKRASVTASTYRSYAAAIRDYLVPTLGRLRLARLRAVQIEHAIERWREGARQDRKAGPRRSATMHTVYAVLRSALTDAHRLELVGANPCARVRPPQRDSSRPEALDAAAARAVLDAVADTELHVVVLLAIATGLRRGELLGLRWPDVDLERGTAAIRQAVTVALDETLVLAPPKTARSVRIVALPAFAREALRAHRAAQDKLREVIGADWNPHGILFPDAEGSLMRPDRLSARFRHLAFRQKLAVRHFHDLRHAFATLSLAAGTDIKVTSHALGHTSVGITADLYSHVVVGLQADAAARLDVLLSTHKTTHSPADSG